MSATITAFFFLLSLSYSSSASPPPHHPFTKIYAFGDSFTDTGNTHSLTGPHSFAHVSNPPYGVTFFHRPTNRYSDGRLVIDFIASALSLPFVPPYLSNTSSSHDHGVNFAVGGATAIEHEFFVKNNMTLDITPASLMTELGWFEKYLKERGGKEDLGKALFWVGEIGVNDYAYTLGTDMKYDVIRDRAMKIVVQFLQTLLKKGAKNIIVQGLPSSGCLPLSLIVTPPTDRDSLGCSTTVDNIASIHNSVLQTHLQALRKQYPSALISYADYFNAHRTILSSPKAHGIAEPFMACCGTGGGVYNFDPFDTCGSPAVPKACKDPAKYVNWDGVHLTEAAYKIVADKFVRGGYCRPSFELFLRR